MTVVVFTRCSPGAMPPRRLTTGAAGYDLAACLPSGNFTVWPLLPGKRLCIPTGLILAIPSGYEGQVRPRSGLALRSGVTVLNAPGTIDSDYRGELQVLLINLGDDTVSIRHGDRIAQLVIAPTSTAELREVETVEMLPGAEGSSRGAGGFGSTGH